VKEAWSWRSKTLHHWRWRPEWIPGKHRCPFVEVFVDDVLLPLVPGLEEGVTEPALPEPITLVFVDMGGFLVLYPLFRILALL